MLCVNENNKMNSKYYKWCVVPQCKNTIITTPNKLFIYVSKSKNIRKKWLQLAGRNPREISITSSVYICEDHFDLPNDMKNYMQYHIMGSVSKIRMKPGCVPTKFECQTNRRNTAQPAKIIKRETVALIEECERELRKSIAVWPVPKNFVFSNDSLSNSEMETQLTETNEFKENIKLEWTEDEDLLKSAVERLHTEIKIEDDETFQNEFDSHNKMYTEQPPFFCTKCDKNFIFSDYLKLHGLKYTGHQFFKCKKCLKTFYYIRCFSLK